MRATLTLECVGWDTRQLSAAGQAQFFSVEPGATAFSVAGKPEQDAVVFLMSMPKTRDLLLRVLGLPADAQWKDRVRHPFIESPSTTPGDIDLLVAATDAPHHAVVAEAKRITVRHDEQGGQVIGRLQAASKGIKQAKGLGALGFSRTYLMLIALVDDRSQAEYNVAFQGTTTGSLRRILEFGEAAQLPSDIGVAYVELSQPQAQPIDHAGFCVATILRPAAVMHQSVDLTSKVHAFLRAHV